MLVPTMQVYGHCLVIEFGGNGTDDSEKGEKFDTIKARGQALREEGEMNVSYLRERSAIYKSSTSKTPRVKYRAAVNKSLGSENRNSPEGRRFMW